MLHILLHFIVPLIVAVVFWRVSWSRKYALMLCGLTIDLDHLLADPIYDASRCSIGFHPLHSEAAMVVYAVLFAASVLWGKSAYWMNARVVLLGVFLHLVLDTADCVF